MNNNKDMNDQKESPHLLILQQIKDGTLDPKTLSTDLRKEFVEIMRDEGYTTSQMARSFEVTDRQIRRDVDWVKKKNSVEPSIEFAKEFVGDMIKKALVHHDYFVRLSNGDISAADKIQARASAWRIIEGLAEKLQTLGFLPMKPTTIVGDVYHHNKGGDSRTYEQLRQDIQEIERVAKETGTLDPKTEEGIKLLQQRVEKAEIVEEIADLNKSKDGDQNNKEEGREQQ
jgi:hypothetical protein